MKIVANRAERFCKDPDPNINIFLIFGSDKGMIREYMRLLMKAKGFDPSDSLSISFFSIEEIRSQPSRLHDEAASFSLLAEKKLIIVEELTDSDKVLIRDFLNNSANTTSSLILLAGNLTTKSQLRKICEEHKSTAAIPAYADDEKSLPNFIRTYFEQEKKLISSDTVFFLSQQLGADRSLTRQELNKIKLYVGDKPEIELDDVRAISANEAGFFLDDLLYTVFDGHLNKIDKLYNLSLENAMQPSIIIQTASKHALRLHAVQSFTNQGAPLEKAIIMTGGPLFWKVGDRFKRQVKGWNNRLLQEAIIKLREATRSSRLNLGIEESLCHRVLISVAATSPLRKRQN